MASPLTTVQVLPAAPTKTSYNFGGWYTAINGGGTAFTSSTTVTGNITVYAYWTLNPVYTVTYDSQSATVNSNPTSSLVTLPATTVGTLPTAPTKTGYTFGGWYTAINGGGSVFDASTTVNANITVYAKWNTYSYAVSYDSQSATVNSNPTLQNVNSPSTTVGSLPAAPTKTGYTFNGWFTATNGGGSLFDASTTVSGNITVYAYWTLNPVYTVTYDSQSATVNANPTSQTVTSPATTVGSLPAAPTKTGYTFIGWFTAINGGGSTFTSSTTVNANITVYACWTPTATRVYGQAGSFTTATANNGGISANSLSNPQGIAVDSSGNVYIVDTGNHRVLYYSGTSTTATRVYGQAGSFTTGTANNGGISANSLSSPNRIAVDSSGNVYIVDTGNQRVLYYSGTSTTATRVYGQAGSFTTGTVNNGGISANSLYYPYGVAVDSSGNVYIADFFNHRALYYLGTSTTATRVYGQAGSFSTSTQGTSANALISAYDLCVDSGGNVYIVDAYTGQLNQRVLYYSGTSTTATRVYGQLGSFTSYIINNGGISANSLNYPYGVAVDSSGNVFIADNNNYRVLYYSGTSTTATRVYGQAGSFTSNTINNGGVSANSLGSATGIAVDSSGHVYISDTSNNRVLFFP